MIYLASPYRHENPETEVVRYEEALKATAWLFSSGEMVFSPIVHSHHIYLYSMRTLDIDWLEMDLKILLCCNQMYILALPGWRESQGILKEVVAAHDLRLSIKLMHLPTWERGSYLITEEGVCSYLDKIMKDNT